MWRRARSASGRVSHVQSRRYVVFGHLPAVGVEVLERVLAHVVALGDVAAEAVAHEDGVLALGAARDEAAARDHHRVAVHVVDVGVHRVLERDLPVAPPVHLADQDQGLLVEELLGHVLLDGGGRALADPHEDEALEGARRDRPSPRCRPCRTRPSSGPRRAPSRSCPTRRTPSRGTGRPPSRGSGSRPRSGARRGAGRCPGSRPPRRRRPRNRQISSPSRETFTGLRCPTCAVLDGRVPVVAQPELRDQVADVAAEPGDAVGRARARRRADGTWSAR